MRNEAAESEMWSLIQAQGGLVAIYQTRELGIAEQTIRTRIKNGSLERICNGVLAAKGAPRTRDFEMMLGLLLAGPRRPGSGVLPALCSFSAAELQDLLDPRPEEPTHVLTTRRVHPKKGYVFHWTSRLPEEEIVSVGSFRVTTPTRTLLDCAATEPYRAMSLFRRGLRRSAFTAAQVADQIQRESRQGRSGIVKVREALNLTGPGAERARSAMEDRVYDLLVSAGHPPPQRNVMVKGLSREWEVDLFYQPSFGIEVSPSWWHADPAVADKDALKVFELDQVGVKIITVTELTTDGEILNRVAAVLGRPDGSQRVSVRDFR